MARSDALAQISKLMSVFRQHELSDSAIEAYVDQLQGVDPQVLATATNRLLSSSRFFPALAEVWDACLSVSGQLPPTPAEILALVRRADVRKPVMRRDGSFTGDYDMRWEWPEDASPLAIDLARDTLARVGEPCDPEGKDRFGWETGFQRAYEPAAAQARQNAIQNATLLRLQAPAVKLVTA